MVKLLKLDDLSAKYEDSKEGLTEIEKDIKFLNEIKGSSSGDKFNARKAMGDNDADNKRMFWQVWLMKWPENAII
ncbi:MAG: hypothetical protein GBAus27B_000013 [Mycoplasmataceae bacterium]|nr:MAG: hypothetical protein GBAus27B_000013 [Mycoplasmataceae bacterium]